MMPVTAFAPSTTSLHLYMHNSTGPIMSSVDALWDRLIKAPTAASNDITLLDLPQRPVVDKHATMIRLLAHDGQAKADATCERIDQLVATVDASRVELEGTRAQFSAAHKEIIGEVDKRVKDMKDELSNMIREQSTPFSQLQRHAEQLSQKVDALDRKHDGLHVTSQTLSSALHQIQEQLISQTSALAPLLPLIMTISTRIDSCMDSQKTLSERMERIEDSARRHYTETDDTLRSMQGKLASLHESLIVSHKQQLFAGLPPSSNCGSDRVEETLPPSGSCSRKRRRLDSTSDPVAVAGSTSTALRDAIINGTDDKLEGDTQESQDDSVLGSQFVSLPASLEATDHAAQAAASSTADVIIPPSTEREVYMTISSSRVSELAEEVDSSSNVARLEQRRLPRSAALATQHATRVIPSTTKISSELDISLQIVRPASENHASGCLLPSGKSSKGAYHTSACAQFHNQGDPVESRVHHHSASPVASPKLKTSFSDLVKPTAPPNLRRSGSPVSFLHARNDAPDVDSNVPSVHEPSALPAGNPGWNALVIPSSSSHSIRGRYWPGLYDDDEGDDDDDEDDELPWLDPSSTS